MEPEFRQPVDVCESGVRSAGCGDGVRRGASGFRGSHDRSRDQQRQPERGEIHRGRAEEKPHRPGDRLYPACPAGRRCATGAFSQWARRTKDDEKRGSPVVYTP